MEKTKNQRKVNTMLHGKLTLFIDQYGNRWEARSVLELRDKIGGGRVSKMYVHDKSGNFYHVGYVVGDYWCQAFVPVRILQ